MSPNLYWLGLFDYDLQICFSKALMEEKSVTQMEPGVGLEPTAILITGGAGFIGSNVLRHLWQSFPKAHFHVLDLLTYAGDIKNINDEVHADPRFTFWYGDVRNSRLVDKLVGQCDYIIHFAAETHVARSIYDDIKFFETDVLGTQVLANAVLRHRDTVKRFIHISTSEVYGTARGDGMAEDHPLEPQSPYAAAKAGADRLVYSYIITYGIPAVIVRPFNIYGPQQHLEKLIPRFITAALMGEPMTIHGTGESMRDYNYVTNAAEAIELLLRASDSIVHGEVFNIGTGEPRSILDVANAIKSLIPTASRSQDFTPYTMNIGDRPGQVFKHVADTTKIRERLGWIPSIDFNEGLKRTVEWYISNQSWWKPKVWMRHVPILTAEGKIEMH